MTTTVVAQGNNFLLPNATFFVELALFAVIFFIFTRYIVPPLAKSMRERDEMIRTAARNRDEAADRKRKAEERYNSELSDARVEAARIRDEARAEAQKIRDEKKKTADDEVAGMHERGRRQLAEQREQAVRQLRGDIGGLSAELAERIVGRPLPGGVQRQSTVDRFLAELDERSGTSAASGTSTGGR